MSTTRSTTPPAAPTAWRATPRRVPRPARETGQTTAEYALVLLGAAGVALLLLGWATQSGAIGELFNAVLDGVIGKAR